MAPRLNTWNHIALYDLSAESFGNLIWSLGTLKYQGAKAVMDKASNWLTERRRVYSMLPRDVAHVVAGFGHMEFYNQNLKYMLERQVINMYLEFDDVVFLGFEKSGIF